MYDTEQVPPESVQFAAEKPTVVMPPGLLPNQATTPVAATKELFQLWTLKVHCVLEPTATDEGLQETENIG